ncbi:cytochrome P450 [Phaeosphaeriaceae sp. PMI808]|nr:cytochrome P450 [Phaeosphaeriaceae sp. PMI808]
MKMASALLQGYDLDISKDPLAKQYRHARRSIAVMEQHKIHRDFVRIGPNHVTLVIFNVRDSESHQRKRKYMNPAFSARAISDFEPYIDDKIPNYLAFNIIRRFAFGKSFRFIEKGEDPYNLISTIDIRGESAGLRATANLKSISRSAYQQRKDNNDSQKDLLSFLFQARDSKGSIKEQEIIAESISFIVGSSNTTSSTITNVIDFISRDLHLQIKLQQELDKAFPDKIMQGLPLLTANLREVIRLRPTSTTGLERIIPSSGRTIARIYFPAGTIISMPTYGLLNNKRLTRESKDLLEYFIPFSTRPRACIGRKATTYPTLVRKGFFNKASECKYIITPRS